MKRVLKLPLKVLIEVLLFGVLTLVSTKLSFAQVIINEVMPAPSQGADWVELRNLSDQDVSFLGWKIEDGSGVLIPSPLLSFSTILGEGYFVFELGNRLNNAGDQLTLRRPDGSVADFFQYSSSQSNKSWSRINEVSAEFVFNEPTKGAANQFASPSASPTPTASLSPSPTPAFSPAPSPLPSSSPSPFPSLSPLPTATSPMPTPIIYQAPLLSEVVACPESGQPEWIELYNPNPHPLTLQGWKLKDATGNNRNLQIDLPATGFGVAEISSSILNNAGDELVLVDQFANPLIHIELPACTVGESTIFVQGKWQQTLSATKGTLNIFTTNQSEVDTQIFTNINPLNSNVSDEIISLDELLTAAQLPLSTTSSATENFPSDNTTDQPFIQLPDLGEFSQSENQDNQLPLDSETKSINSLEEGNNSKPFFLSRTIILCLFMSSFLCLVVGSIGGYQWYTERRVETALEDF